MYRITNSPKNRDLRQGNRTHYKALLRSKHREARDPAFLRYDYLSSVYAPQGLILSLSDGMSDIGCMMFEGYVRRAKAENVDELIIIGEPYSYDALAVSKLCEAYEIDLLVICYSTLFPTHLQIEPRSGVTTTVKFVHQNSAFHAIDARIEALKAVGKRSEIFNPSLDEIVTASTVFGLLDALDKNNPISLESVPEIWFAVTNGRLARCLDIVVDGRCKLRGVAVSQDLSDGEKGAADVEPHTTMLSCPSVNAIDIPMSENIDAKAFDYFCRSSQPGSIFIVRHGPAYKAETSSLLDGIVTDQDAGHIEHIARI